jgi:hypothetical protein
VIKSRRLESAGYVVKGEVHIEFWWGNLRERDQMEYRRGDRRIILKLIFGKWNRDTHWTDLAQHRDRLLAVVNAVMNLRFPQNVGRLLNS